MTCHNKAIELDPNLKQAYNFKGQAYKEWGKYDDAIIEYNLALSLDDRDPQCYYLRGMASFSVGKHYDAIKDYEIALRLAPTFLECYQIYGIALQGIVSNYLFLIKKQILINFFDIRVFIQKRLQFTLFYKNYLLVIIHGIIKKLHCILHLI